ncbi:MAG: bifunctional phosphoribosyl-AMP cyclohydrolase/phosphoribosyl-ATP diphosphatase HisIE [Christensenellales bacterium]|jgi:phosphoribosyl-ATP pyrophosphohydrolase/phosphoribosyl-AMP cyclohydrolase
MKADISNIKFDDKGLVPAIAQDERSAKVLMLAYMNKEALEQTINTGKATYFSRSRQKLWVKGETSGNEQKVKGIYYDCDADAVLLSVEQTGPACHTGEKSCFYNTVKENTAASPHIISELYDVITDRRVNPREGSYTNYLFDKGLDKMCKKLGEEAAECIIAAKNLSADELRYEAADLIYHLLVLMAETGLEPSELYSELRSRR